jgi:hypothetical protein
MMKLSAIVWCFAPWIVAAGTSLLGWIDMREAVRTTAFTFFMLYPATMAAGLIVAKAVDA